MTEKCVCIICGGRDNHSMEELKKAIEESGFEIDEVVQGGAKGADTLAKKWAKENDIPCTEFPAKWNDLSVDNCKVKHGQYGAYNAFAGFNRNQEMADYSNHCIALSGGNGTEDMIKRAQEGELNLYVHGRRIQGVYQF